MINNNDKDNNPIVGAWISPDGLYAFIELRTSKEAELALALNNVSIFGQRLKVGKPRFKKPESSNDKRGQKNSDGSNSSSIISL